MGDFTDLIRTLNDGASEVGEVEVLLDSARQTFRLVEPWFQASSDHPIVKSIISNIQEQACTYFDAIKLSIKTASTGYTFAEDAISLCEFLAQGHSGPEVFQFVEDMQKTAYEASHAAKVASQKFRSVRVGLLAITNLVSSSAAQILDEGSAAQISKDRHRKRAHYASLISGVIGFLPPVLSLAPHAVIILPAVIPLLFLVEVVKQTSTRRGNAREQQQITCENAVTHLQQINADLGKLVDSVDRFSDWWTDMDTVLGSIVANSGRLEPENLDKARITMLHGRWKEVKRKYLSYKQGISRLQDFFPSDVAGGVAAGLLTQERGKLLQPVTVKAIASAPRARSTPQDKVDNTNTMISLAKCVEECRLIFDTLKPDHLLANGNPPFQSSARLNKARILMKGVWEELILYLRDFHAFGDEVELSIHNLGSESKDGRIARSNKIWASVTRLLTNALAIKYSHVAVCQILQELSATSTEFPSSSTPNPKSLGKISQKSMRYNKIQRSPTTGTDNIQVVDDMEELHAVETALMEVSRYLDELVRFWHDRSNVYGLVDDAPWKDTAIAQPSYTWQVYRAASGAALLSISSSCDSLMIDVAVETPPPAYDPSGGRRFGKFPNIRPSTT